MTTMPADSGPLALLPIRDARTDGVDHTGHFMTRDTRIDQTGPVPVLGEDIAMADATCLDLDPDPIGARFRNRTFDNFQCTAGSGDLYGYHL
jgi:hypothetical protein